MKECDTQGSDDLNQKEEEEETLLRMSRGYSLATFGPVGGRGGGGGGGAAIYSESGSRLGAARDELTSRVLPAIHPEHWREYHRPRSRKEGPSSSSSSWALVRSVGRKISGLWPFWSEGGMEGEEESVIARRRLGKSSRRLRPPPVHGSRGRHGGMVLGPPPRLDRGPVAGTLWSVRVESGEDVDGEGDLMVRALRAVEKVLLNGYIIQCLMSKVL